MAIPKILLVILFLILIGTGIYWLSKNSPITAPTNLNSGIYGTAKIGPTCPVENVEQPCPPQFYQGNFIVSSKSYSTKFSSDAQGNFRVNLPSGDYNIQQQSTNSLPILKPVDVTVTTGNFTQVDLSLDTGIR